MGEFVPLKVFISYRREDTGGEARRLRGALRKVLPHDHVFMDVDSIQPGLPFRQVLERWVTQCDVVVALIGPKWLDLLPGTDAEQDYVQLEVGRALELGKRLVPVLVDQPKVPEADQLPVAIRGLLAHQAEFFQSTSADADIARLVAGLGRDGRKPASMSHIAGTRLQDAPFAPELVVVPPGRFVMGSATSHDNGWGADELPAREVTIAYPLAVGRFPVTFDEWDAFRAAAGRGVALGDEGWGRGNRPVIRVAWDRAVAYVEWLSAQTGARYRLLSEAEWEYCCRAGTDTEYSFGDTITTAQACYDRTRTAEVGKFAPNAFGLSDMHGNVWEWCQDHWHDTYAGAPCDGSAWLGTQARVLRGGCWQNDILNGDARNWPWWLRSRARTKYAPETNYNTFGLRVAREL